MTRQSILNQTTSYAKLIERDGFLYKTNWMIGVCPVVQLIDLTNRK